MKILTIFLHKQLLAPKYQVFRIPQILALRILSNFCDLGQKKSQKKEINWNVFHDSMLYHH